MIIENLGYANSCVIKMVGTYDTIYNMVYGNHKVASWNCCMRCWIDILILSLKNFVIVKTVIDKNGDVFLMDSNV